ncbi:MAG: hypothetical protein ATN35_09025 [Epulopiscium sp. Nele67-Bin004]|nr:MAG: hypothetical protein ATN35_09025 [Epulopiscium sp. Nele67-Bin004]
MKFLDNMGCTKDLQEGLEILEQLVETMFDALVDADKLLEQKRLEIEVLEKDLAHEKGQVEQLELELSNMKEQLNSKEQITLEQILDEIHHLSQKV